MRTGTIGGKRHGPQDGPYALCRARNQLVTTMSSTLQDSVNQQSYTPDALTPAIVHMRLVPIKKSSWPSDTCLV